MTGLIVKVENRKGQTRITIPRSLAVRSGLSVSELARVELGVDDSLKVRRVDVSEEKERCNPGAEG